MFTFCVCNIVQLLTVRKKIALMGRTIKGRERSCCAMPLPERCIGLSFAEFMASARRPFVSAVVWPSRPNGELGRLSRRTAEARVPSAIVGAS